MATSARSGTPAAASTSRTPSTADAAGRPLSHPWPRLPAMMKRSHAVIGAAAGVAVAHATGASMVAGGIVAGLAGLLPDIDHPHAAVGRLLPRWWHRLTPGHRGPPNSLAGGLAVAMLAYVGNSAANGRPAGQLLALTIIAGSLKNMLAEGLTV